MKYEERNGKIKVILEPGEEIDVSSDNISFSMSYEDGIKECKYLNGLDDKQIFERQCEKWIERFKNSFQELCEAAYELFDNNGVTIRFDNYDGFRNGKIEDIDYYKLSLALIDEENRVLINGVELYFPVELKAVYMYVSAECFDYYISKFDKINTRGFVPKNYNKESYSLIKESVKIHNLNLLHKKKLNELKRKMLASKIEDYYIEPVAELAENKKLSKVYTIEKKKD